MLDLRVIADPGIGEGELELVLELPVRGLDDDDPLRVREDGLERLARERPDGDGSEESGLDSSGPEGLDRALRHPRGGGAGDEDDLGVVAQVEVGALLDLHRRVLLVQVDVPCLEVGLGQVDRRNEISAVVAIAPDAPLRDARFQHRLRKVDLARHLAEVAVGGDDHRVAVLEGQVERQHRQVEHLLRRRRRQDDGVRVAVAEAAAGQLDVRLFGGDVAKARPAAHDVHDDGRNLRADHVGDPLEHQRKARGGGKRQAAHARSAAAVHHVHGGDLGDGLQEHAVEVREELGHQLGAFRRRGDRIAEEVPAAGQESADGGRVVPLQDERLHLRKRDGLVRNVDRFRGVGHPVAEELRGVLELVVGVRRGLLEPVRLGAGVDAESAAVAVFQVQDDRGEPGLGVDLGPHRDAMLRAGADTAAAPLAELGEDERFRSFLQGGHGASSGAEFTGPNLMKTHHFRGNRSGSEHGISTRASTRAKGIRDRRIAQRSSRRTRSATAARRASMRAKKLSPGQAVALTSRWP